MVPNDSRTGAAVASITHRTSGIPVFLTMLCATFLAFDAGLIIAFLFRSLLGFWLMPVASTVMFVLAAHDRSAQLREQRHYGLHASA